MTGPLPAAITSDGNCKVFFTPTLADPANPTVAEATSASGFDVSCYLTDDGWAPSISENAITDARLCSVQVFEGVGTSTEGLVIKYIYRAQDPTSPTNKPFSTFKPYTTGFFLVRYGIRFAPDLAAADIVDTIPVEFGVQQKLPGAANEKQKIQQTVRITGPIQRDVVVVS